jgi:hypothetical protein
MTFLISNCTVNKMVFLYKYQGCPKLLTPKEPVFNIQPSYFRRTSSVFPGKESPKWRWRVYIPLKYSIALESNPGNILAEHDESHFRRRHSSTTLDKLQTDEAHRPYT